MRHETTRAGLPRPPDRIAPTVAALVLLFAVGAAARAQGGSAPGTDCPVEKPGRGQAWDLRHLARYALCNNPQQRAQRASAAINQANRPGDDPSNRTPLDLSVNVRRTESTMPTVRMDNGNSSVASSVGSSLSSSLTERTYTTNRTAIIEGSYSIYDFGAESANRARARFQENAAAASLDASQQTLLSEVAQRYAEAVSRRDEPSDPTATAPLAAVVGLDPLGRLAVARPVTLAFEPPGRWEDWWVVAEERPDLRAARARVDADRETVNVARAGDKGRVGVALSVSPGYSNITGRSDAESLNLSYTLPLANLYPSAPAVETAQAHLQTGEADVRSLRDQASKEVRDAWARYRTAYTAASQVLSRGTATARHTTVAWTPETAGALVPLLLARAELLRAAGLLDPDTLEHPAAAAPSAPPARVAADAVPAARPTPAAHRPRAPTPARRTPPPR